VPRRSPDGRPHHRDDRCSQRPGATADGGGACTGPLGQAKQSTCGTLLVLPRVRGPLVLGAEVPEAVPITRILGLHALPPGGEGRGDPNKAPQLRLGQQSNEADKQRATKDHGPVPDIETEKPAVRRHKFELHERPPTRNLLLTLPLWEIIEKRFSARRWEYPRTGADTRSYPDL
jgi:hypothetical protein